MEIVIVHTSLFYINMEASSIINSLNNYLFFHSIIPVDVKIPALAIFASTSAIKRKESFTYFIEKVNIQLLKKLRAEQLVNC